MNTDLSRYLLVILVQPKVKIQNQDIVLDSTTRNIIPLIHAIQPNPRVQLDPRVTVFNGSLEEYLAANNTLATVQYPVAIVLPYNEDTVLGALDQDPFLGFPEEAWQNPNIVFLQEGPDIVNHAVDLRSEIFFGRSGLDLRFNNKFTRHLPTIETRGYRNFDSRKLEHIDMIRMGRFLKEFVKNAPTSVEQREAYYRPYKLLFNIIMSYPERSDEFINKLIDDPTVDQDLLQTIQFVFTW